MLLPAPILKVLQQLTKPQGDNGSESFTQGDSRARGLGMSHELKANTTGNNQHRIQVETFQKAAQAVKLPRQPGAGALMQLLGGAL